MPNASWVFGPLTLAAASANNIALAQTPGAAGNLVLNGAAVAAGVATLDVARRVLVTTVADESGKTLTITGTDRYGRVQSEVMTGPNATTGFTNRDYLTVTQVAVSAAFAGNVTVGTNSIASYKPCITDQFANQQQYGITFRVTGVVTFQAETTNEDFSPEWDLAANVPIWKVPAGFGGLGASMVGQIPMPCAAIRFTILTGTGSVQMTVQQALGFQPI